MNDEYEEIDGADDGRCDYEWTEFKVLRKKDTGEWFAGYNSGCSCNWFWDDPELTPVSGWQEAVEVAKTYPYLDEGSVFEMANRLAQRLDL